MKVYTSLATLSPTQWDALSACPFTSHAFLSALEETGCVSLEKGWLPQFIIEETEGVLTSALPLYLKTHSQGEYVFDHAFAQAYERAGGRYYPKFQAAVPFTPVPSKRLLGANPQGLVKAALELCETRNASSLHVTFCTKEEQGLLAENGFLPRLDQQFHFINKGYSSFDDFLETLTSRKRKAIKRERREALENGLTIEWVGGQDIQEHHLKSFFNFYEDTGARKWGQPYLNYAFFKRLCETMPEKLLFIFAMREGKPIAGALNFIGQDRLFGRYWGATEHHPFLHFEVCYYQAIDYALKHGLKVVEAGAQGEHKLLRGYEPVLTYSAHYFKHDGLRNAVNDYLQGERDYVKESQTSLLAATPFKKENK